MQGERTDNRPVMLVGSIIEAIDWPRAVDPDIPVVGTMAVVSVRGAVDH